jgi:sarcosine oxidase subunit alpha
MSAGRRLPTGGEIDRSRPLSFCFEGQTLSGYAGDTVASALLAAGVQVLARSFKYHRPRGLLGVSHEEPNAILDLRVGERHDPNARATLEPLEQGMQLTPIHVLGSVRHDLLALLDRCARFIPAAFYYKTFMWPGWLLYEGLIRRLAGLGRVDPRSRVDGAAHRHLAVDLCVIGAGPAGLAAARAGLAAGRSVLLVEQRSRVGGSLLWCDARVDGEAGADWAQALRDELARLGVRIMTGTTAVGLYDHQSVVLHERSQSAGGRITLVRAGRIVLASGAIERPLLFADNDRPGIMLADAALEYLRRYAVRAGERIVFATTNDTAYAAARAFVSAGARCTIVDARAAAAPMQAARLAGIEVWAGERVAQSLGKPVLTGVRLVGGRVLPADLLAVSGGWTPLIHLYCQARGKPRWDAARGILLPGEPVPGMVCAGAVNGAASLAAALAEGTRAAGEAAAFDVPAGEDPGFDWGTPPDTSMATGKRRVWVDLQHDVTAKDIALAVRENFRNPEHLKRYTTLGMANDQGRTSNINGLALLAELTGKPLAESGVTTFRPPFLPVPLAAVAGMQRGALQAPLRRLPAESVHRAEGAELREYGNLLRPAFYGNPADALQRECVAARARCVILDASSLGKIDIIGPDAAALLDFVSYTTMSTLAPGRLRYGLALAESGAIYDDGVVLRVAADHFVVSCSSGHVAAMVAHFEAWREDRFDLARVFVHDATPHWATMAISGPQSRRVLEALELGVDLHDAAFPHMSARDGMFMGGPARIARVSFTGERSYEVSVPAGLAGQLWRGARAAGAEPLGVESLGVLRCEKGFIYVGIDTDSETMPHDIGMGRPREKRVDAYLGDRSLFTPAACRDGRRQLVGVAAAGKQPLPVGAHALSRAGNRPRSIGWITSSYPSAALGRPVALALIENGASRHGEILEFEHLGKLSRGTLVAPCFLDPAGERLRV